MGFLTVGRRFLLDQNEIIDDRIDVVCRGLLGLTVTCARCHDHKFDPIPTEDYYSLYGVFASSIEPDELPLLRSVAESGPGPPTSSGSSSAAKKARDDFLAARRDEVRGRSDRAGSPFTSRRRTTWTSTGEAGGWTSARGRQARRAAAPRSDRALEASSARRRRKAADPVLGPWRAFAALPASEFAARAEGSAPRPDGPARCRKPAPMHPLVARAVLGSRRRAWPTWSRGTSRCSAELETRWKEHKAQLGRRGRAPVCPSRNGSRSVRRSFGPNGPLGDRPVDDARLFLDQTQRDSSIELNGAIETAERDASGGPGPGDGHERRAQAGQPARLHPRQSRPAGQGGPAAVPPACCRAATASRSQKGSGRLELARAIADPRTR